MTLFEQLCDLPLTVETCELSGLELAVSQKFRRRTTVVRLAGGGYEGFGEDVTYEEPDQTAFQAQGPPQGLAGRWTLGSFSARLGEIELWPTPPTREDSLPYRRWAFEGAALDLCLRQAGLSLARALEREPRPLRFVASTGLGSPPTMEPVERRLAVDPRVGVKVDWSPGWTEELASRLGATGAIEVVDLKGHYRGTPVDAAPDAAAYRCVAERLPDAWLEDPWLDERTEPALRPHRARIAWDAPIHSVTSIEELPFRPGAINVKPSRFGTLRALLETYEHLAANDIPTYGGGQFELGPGRGQIQILAALFHAGAGNDVAPSSWNEAALSPDLPRSPLAPPPDADGFRWVAGA